MIHILEVPAYFTIFTQTTKLLRSLYIGKIINI